MADASTTAALAVAVGAYTSGLTDGTVGDVDREAAAPVASVMSPPMSSMCDMACVTDVSEMCTVAGQEPVSRWWQVQDSNLRRNTPTDLQSGVARVVAS